VLSSSDLAPETAASSKKAKQYLQTMKDVRVEKLVIINPPISFRNMAEIRVEEEGAKGRMVQMKYMEKMGARAAWAVVRDPGVGVARGWRVG